MRQKRAKQYRKQMLVYQHTFKFREPYQVIVDDEIVLGCSKASFDLGKGLERTLQAEVKPMITQCCIQKLYETRDQRAIDMAKSFERRRCNHPPKDPIPPHECIKSIVNISGENKHRYVVASDNDKLRYSLRKLPGVPLVYMNRSVMVMEPLSVASAKVSKNMEKSKLTQGLNNVKSGVVLEKKEEIEEEEGVEKKEPKKRKGPKQPNPLSMKKKKVEQPQQKPTEKEPKKRRRSHKKKEGEDAAEGVTSIETTKATDQETTTTPQ
jgi:U3 small nucleolar RNA-associated protein 23